MTRAITRPRRSVAAFLAAALAASIAAVVPTAEAQVPAGEADFGGYATGTVAHADAIQTADGMRLEDTEVAFSGAAAESTGLATSRHNEMERVVQPSLDGKNSYGRGSGLEVGLGLESPDAENQAIIAGLAEAAAPPSTELVTEEGAVPADPLAYASLARGQAQARWLAPPQCVLGADLSFGLGHVADVQLLDTQNFEDQSPEDPEGADDSLEKPLIATNATDPDRAVSQSTSRTRLVPQIDRDGNVEGEALGMMSETRMTIAPITIGQGQGGVTVEFLGEWVLRAVATGHSGWVHYGPGEVSPETPILRIIPEGEDQETTTILTFQDFFGEDALPVPLVEIEELGLEIAIGEDPRAIGGEVGSDPTETATEASGAVDAARIRVLEGGPLAENFQLDHGLDLRVGHMEVEARTPAGGITCDLPVEKSSDKDTVEAGEEFTYTITVENPYECTLTDVRVEDQVGSTDDATFEILGASDGGQVDDDAGTVTWADIGPIEPGASTSVTIDMKAGDDSGAGLITDVVDVTANCALGSADGSTEVDVSLSGSADVQLPEVAAPEPEVAGAQEQASEPLPRTGGPLAGAAALALLGGAAFLRRFRA